MPATEDLSKPIDSTIAENNVLRFLHQYWSIKLGALMRQPLRVYENCSKKREAIGTSFRRTGCGLVLNQQYSEPIVQEVLACRL